MKQHLEVVVENDDSVVVYSDGLELPGNPQIVIAYHRDDETSEVSASMFVANESSWKAVDLVNAIGGTFGSLQEKLKFGDAL